MSNLAKLNLSATSPREPITPLARKRIKLLAKLDQQIQAAQAEVDDEEFIEEIKRWVRDEQTGEKRLVTQHRPLRKWWWNNQHGVLMVCLRDGNRIVPLGQDKTSVEVGTIEQLVSSLETLREAVVAGELDKQLEVLISERKIPNRKKGKALAAKAA